MNEQVGFRPVGPVERPVFFMIGAVKNWMGLLALAFAWTHRIGEQLHNHECPISLDARYEKIIRPEKET